MKFTHKRVNGGTFFRDDETHKRDEWAPESRCAVNCEPVFGCVIE
jgi:hypothetical protein